MSAWPRLRVAGVPAPQGSKTRGRHGSMYESSKLVGPWRERVGLAAAELVDEPTRAPVVLSLKFTTARPSSHLKRDGGLRAGAPQFPSRPDVDKLARAVLDALTGVLYVDDGQVAELHLTKGYGAEPGVEISWGLL